MDIENDLSRLTSINLFDRVVRVVMLFEVSSPRTLIHPACSWITDYRGTRHNI
jgi:hypothetical protein